MQPTDEEASALKGYLQPISSEEAKKKALSALNACERYMVEMMEVPSANDKFNCMIFKRQFDNRIKDQHDGVDKVLKACKQIRSSNRLRTLFAMILTVGNQINTGGSGNVAAGFNLEALLKLDEVGIMTV